MYVANGTANMTVSELTVILDGLVLPETCRGILIQ
jgi:hypothetical protein